MKNVINLKKAIKKTQINELKPNLNYNKPIKKTFAIRNNKIKIKLPDSSEEQLIFFKKTMQELGIKIRKEKKKKISLEKLYQVFQGLLISKKRFGKIPSEIILEELEDCSGYFQKAFPERIHIDLSSGDVFSTTIHETAHKNDTNILGFIGDLIAPPIIKQNKNLIKNEIGSNACTDRDEFIAETAEYLISYGKTWNDVDPKIKRLYKILFGPKLNLPMKP